MHVLSRSNAAQGGTVAELTVAPQDDFCVLEQEIAELHAILLEHQVNPILFRGVPDSALHD